MILIFQLGGCPFYVCCCFGPFLSNSDQQTYPTAPFIVSSRTGFFIPALISLSVSSLVSPSVSLPQHHLNKKKQQNSNSSKTSTTRAWLSWTNGLRRSNAVNSWQRMSSSPFVNT